MSDLIEVDWPLSPTAAFREARNGSARQSLIGTLRTLSTEAIISNRNKNLILVDLNSKQERRITHAKHKDQRV